MRIDTIRIAKKEAEEFIKRAKSVIDENNANNYNTTYPSKYTGALRRTSLELTRLLAEMRKP